MTEETTGAVEAAEPVDVSTPEPAEAAPEPAPASTRDAVARALGEALDDKPEPAPKPEGQEGAERDAQGRFLPKGNQPPEAAKAPVPEAPAAAPAGLSDDVKAAWATVPPNVRKDVERRIGELETGIKGYQTEFGELKPFAEMAKSQGTTLAAAVRNYVNMENLLRSDPRAGFERLAQNLGVKLSDIVGGEAAPAEGQPNNEAAQYIGQLQQHIARLEQQIAQVPQMFDQHLSSRDNKSAVERFVGERGIDQTTRQQMGQVIQAGLVSPDLPVNEMLAAAFEVVQKINGTPPPAAPAADTQAAQTRASKAKLAVSGAPASGSDPGNRKTATSSREAAAMALRAAGL